MTIAACAALVERGDPDRFAATMAAPPAMRAVLFPLYAFNLEVARAPFVTAEPMIAEMRLQWWRDTVEEAGKGTGGVRPAHEVAGPLAGVIWDHILPVALFDAAIAARRWDIYKEPFADKAALRAHLDATAGNLCWLACLASGADARWEAAARQVAFAGGLANWLMAVPEYEARGRFPLFDGRPVAVAALAAEGLRALRSARAARFGPGIPALRTFWQAGAILGQAAREPGRVADGTLGTSEFRRRAGLMLRAAAGRW